MAIGCWNAQNNTEKPQKKIRGDAFAPSRTLLYYLYFLFTFTVTVFVTPPAYVSFTLNETFFLCCHYTMRPIKRSCFQYPDTANRIIFLTMLFLYSIRVLPTPNRPASADLLRSWWNLSHYCCLHFFFLFLLYKTTGGVEPPIGELQSPALAT